jgi:hypothetical protein
MTVWLYDTCGPERRVCGVTDDEKRARRLARESLRSVEANTALVEQVYAALELKTLLHVYQRTGQGWQARLTPGGRIAWKRLTAAASTPPRAVS